MNVQSRWTLFSLSVLMTGACTGAIERGDSTEPPETTTGQMGARPGAKDPVTGAPAQPGTSSPGGMMMTSPPPASSDPTCQGLSVGPSPLRRLTRSQYRNTVRDLAGVDVDADSALTPDEKAGNFSSNLVVPADELLVGQLQTLAETVAGQAAVETLVPCEQKAQGDAGCARAFIETFGRRAFRRPLAAAEVKRYEDFYAKRPAGQAHGERLRLLVRAMLQSPTFLYHGEFTPDGAPQPGKPAALDPYALASRLSYFLWDSMPDDALFEVARSGRLSEEAIIEEQVTRMLADARSERTMARFHMQWLHLEKLDTVKKDAKVFPVFNDQLRAAMRSETMAFLRDAYTRPDGNLQGLFTTSKSFLTDPLFGLYGVTKPAGHTPGKAVPLDPAQRSGLLTQATFLSAHAHPNQTSPVARGIAVRESLLCQHLPMPPDDADTTAPEPSPNATTRERFLEHQKDPTCKACHALIDDLGLGFEAYDGIGRFRTMENGRPIDARGNVASAMGIEGPFDGAIELSRKLAGSEVVAACLTSQWFTYALGRPEDQADRCVLDGVFSRWKAGGYSMRQLLVELAKSSAFRQVSAQQPE